MYTTKERTKPLYAKKDNKPNFDLSKLKKNAIRVEERNGHIKLDKRNKDDVDWYFG